MCRQLILQYFVEESELHVNSSTDIRHHKVDGEFLLLLTTLSSVYNFTRSSDITS